MLRSDTPKHVFGVEAIGGFRDLIAASVVPYNQALEIVYPHGRRVLWSNNFDFHPYMIDKDYEYAICSSPAVLSLDQIEKFRGQASPEVARIALQSSDFDHVLLSALIAQWQVRYLAKRPDWKSLALFRALNMAYQASRLPGSRDVTIYDVGRSVALWVSAFEILAHPSDGDSNLREVTKLFDRVAWIDSDLKRETFDCFASRRGGRIKGNLARWLYGEIYHARNDFLHGNQISSDRLIIKQSGRNLFYFAAPLFRMALTSFLGLAFKKKMPSTNNSKAFGKYISDRMNYEQYQKVVERSLAFAHVKPIDEGEQ